MKRPIFILFMIAMLLALLLTGCGQKTRDGGNSPPAATPADHTAGAGSSQPADDPVKDDETTLPQHTQIDAPENISESPEAGGKTGEEETAKEETDALLDSILEQLDSLDKLYSDLEEDNLTDSDLTD